MPVHVIKIELLILLHGCFYVCRFMYVDLHQKTNYLRRLKVTSNNVCTKIVFSGSFGRCFHKQTFHDQEFADLAVLLVLFNSTLSVLIKIVRYTRVYLLRNLQDFDS